MKISKAQAQRENLGKMTEEEIVAAIRKANEEYLSTPGVKLKKKQPKEPAGPPRLSSRSCR